LKEADLKMARHDKASESIEFGRISQAVNLKRDNRNRVLRASRTKVGFAM